MRKSTKINARSIGNETRIRMKVAATAIRKIFARVSAAAPANGAASRRRAHTLGRYMTLLGSTGLLFAAATRPAAAESSMDAYMPAPAEPGTDIPNVPVKFGMKPYADNSFYVIAMKKDWFKDVGITIMPQPIGLSLTEENVIPLLLNGQLDLSSNYCPSVLPTYKSSKLLKCIAFTDNIVANSILANPKLNLKPFSAYIKEGKNFQEAIKAALAPADGKTLTAPPDINARPFEEALYKIAGIKMNLQALDDAKLLVLARSDRTDFAHPNGAPIVYSLMQAGWVPLVNMKDLLQYGPAGPDSPLENLIAIVGTTGNANFINKNPNTVLRFLSVVWRTIDAVKKDPSLYDLQAPYLNSIAGTNLDGYGVAQTVATLHPYKSFKEDAEYYEDAKSTVYYKNVYGAIIKDFEQHKVLPVGAVTAETFVWNAPIWEQMKAYKAKTEQILDGLKPDQLSAEKKELVAKSRQYYAWYDYLDSFRLATAAAAP
jgi:hypothetical protein